jgi:hypothetical protein
MLFLLHFVVFFLPFAMQSENILDGIFKLWFLLKILYNLYPYWFANGKAL